MERIWITNIDQAREFFSDFGLSFSFDTETTSSAIEDYRRTHGVDASLPKTLGRQALNYYYLDLEAMSFCDGKKAGFIMFDYIKRSEFLEIFKQHLSKAKTVVAHNIAFDMKVMHKYGVNFEGVRIYCTMVADHLIDENRQHGLKDLAKKFLGQEETISWAEARKKGGKTWFDYTINDAIWCWELCKIQQPLLKREGVAKLFREIEMPFQFVIMDMEINGFLIDKRVAEETTTVLLDAKEKFTTEMLEYLGERFSVQMKLDGSMEIISPINFESPAQLVTVCRDRLGLEEVEQTKSGNYSVDKVFMSKHKNHDFIKILNKYKIASQLYKLFFKPLPELMDGDGRVRASFKDTGTVTGRLSCSQPNLQQLAKPKEEFPIETRAAFIAGEGRKMITADFSGQEVCIMVEESGDENIKDILLKNQDVHLKTAKDAFDAPIPEEALSRDHPDYKMYCEKFSKERAKAKIFNFALPYGKGAFGFAKDYGITEEEAQVILDKYFTANRGLKEAMDKAKEEVQKYGSVTYLSGRKKHFQKVKGQYGEEYPMKAMRQAFNAKIQGFGADMMRIALNRVRDVIKQNPHLGIEIQATVHDEAVCTCKEEHLEESCKLIKEAFEGSVKLVVPLLSDIGVGNNYSEAK